jgi:hypothetical protein
MDTRSGEPDSPLVLAEAELARWCEHYAAIIPTIDMDRWWTARQIILTQRRYVPEYLARRLCDALGGCETPQDVRMVFASVQEQQLCSAG